MGAADRRRPQRRAAAGRHLRRRRNGRRFRQPDPTDGEIPEIQRRETQMRPARRKRGPRIRRRMGRQNHRHQRPQTTPDAAQPLRFSRRGRRRTDAVAEIGHTRRQGLRRLSGVGAVFPQPQPRNRATPQRQSIRTGFGGRAADVGSPPRHAPCGRPALPDVRPLRGLQTEFPKTGFADGFAAIHPPAQHLPDAARGLGQYAADQIPLRRTAQNQGRAARVAAGILSAGRPRRLGTDYRRPARAGD